MLFLVQSTWLSGSTLGAVLQEVPEVLQGFRNPSQAHLLYKSLHLWDQCLALPVCPAVTPPCESAVHAHPVLLPSLRPFWCFPASPCQTGKGKPGQWPELSAFPFCTAVLPGRAVMQGWAGEPLPCRHGDSWAFLAGFHKQGSKTTFPVGGRQETTCMPQSRALRHWSLPWALQHTGSQTDLDTWHSPYCDSSPRAHSNGPTSECCKRRPQIDGVLPPPSTSAMAGRRQPGRTTKDNPLSHRKMLHVTA